MDSIIITIPLDVEGGWPDAVRQSREGVGAAWDVERAGGTGWGLGGHILRRKEPTYVCHIERNSF
jgi:hypothetical protein